MKPNGAPMIHSATSAPTAPNGTAAKTMNGLTAFLNWNVSARKIASDRDRQHDREIAEAVLLLLLFAADFELVARRQRRGDGIERRRATASSPPRPARRPAARPKP